MSRPSCCEGADLVLDGGELPGRPSTVVDLRDYASERRWHVLREGALHGTRSQQKLAPRWLRRAPVLASVVAAATGA